MTRQLALQVRLPDLASFDNFHGGPNREAVAAVRSLALDRSGVLFLHGASGTGKSHLMYAATKEAASAGRHALYVSRAADRSGSGEWLDLPGEGLTCVDDINDGLTPAESTALFSLYERTRAAAGSLLVASRLPANEVDWVLPDLRSRMQSDLVYRLSTLDEEDLEAALRLRARQRGLDLSDDVVRFVLRRYERSPAALFRLLDQIDLESLARKRRVTIPFLRALEADIDGSSR